MHIFNAGGSARWGPVPFMKKKFPVEHCGTQIHRVIHKIFSDRRRPVFSEGGCFFL